MAEMPKSIQVGPVVYTVEGNAEKMKTHRLKTTSGDWAYVWHNLLEVVVDPELAEGQQRECLMHETLHCILRTAQLTSDETLAAQLAPALLDTLRRNPDLVAYLTASS